MEQASGHLEKERRARSLLICADNAFDETSIGAMTEEKEDALRDAR